MSLDKWVNPEKKKKKTTKREEKVEDKLNIKSEGFTKFILSCSKKQCNYQKTIIKKKLNEKDKTCPRCKSVMQIKNANGS